MKRNERNRVRHILAMMLFCMVISIGMVCRADVKGTVIAKSAVIRAAADPNSAKLASVPSGKVIDIISKASGTDGKYWYQVYVDSDTRGYIRSDLIKVPDGANIPTTQGGTTSSNQPADTTSTTVTPVEPRQVTVISNNTNIRASASTSSESKAKANRGTQLTVTGEVNGADGKKWYQVSYQNSENTGFIRSDLVTTDNVSQDPATSQITGLENSGEEQPPETVPEEQPPAQPEQPAETTPPDSANDITPMNVEEEPPYIMSGFKPLKFRLPSGDEEYNGYANGNFLICYARKSDGEEGWFLIDRERNVFQRYAYTVEGVTVPKGGIESIGLVPVIVLVVIIVILVAVVGLLALKLKGQNYKKYKGYDDDEEQEDDDIEDLEDLEDEEEPQLARRPPQGPQPVRRPQGPPANGAPSNSGNAPQGPQPVRRPQGPPPPRHPQNQQPPRRPLQGMPSNSGNAPQGPQPVRRPQGVPTSNMPQGQPPRRPQGPPPRRPQPQNDRGSNERGQAQKGYKVKNLLEDDDMDFMDIE